MKYELEITINLPRKRVIELFDNPDNLKKWQDGLQSFTHRSGTPGEVGAQSDIVYQMGKRRIEMVETITKRNLPDEFSGTYEADGMWNLVENFFIEQDENTTLYRTRHTFECKTFMLKVMAFLMPGAFKKQSLKYMNDFKKFAENS
jgi:carbon monoxide dehydrogenase subunit G